MHGRTHPHLHSHSRTCTRKHARTRSRMHPVQHMRARANGHTRSHPRADARPHVGHTYETPSQASNLVCAGRTVRREARRCGGRCRGGRCCGGRCRGRWRGCQSHARVCPLASGALCASLFARACVRAVMILRMSVSSTSVLYNPHIVFLKSHTDTRATLCNIQQLR